MKILLKGIWVDSAEYSLESYSPYVDDVYIWVNLRIGPDNQEGADDFQVLVCSIEWLSKNIYEPEILRHTLVVRKYDLDEITETINKYIEKCTCKTWEETAQKLSRYFAWEFEDYSD